MESQKRKHTAHSGYKNDCKRIKTRHFKVSDLRDDLPFSTEECMVWFNKYADTENGNMEASIGPEGIEKLCQDLQLDPENIVMLVLAWKLKASQMGYFLKKEWLVGMRELECDSCEKLKKKMTSLRQLLFNESHFKSIFQYSFDFAKSVGHRNLDIDTGKAMLKLLLETRWPIFPQFLEFLETSKYKVLNRDQWNNILEFSRTIKPDLSNYDVNGAWPVLLDEFVEKHKPNQMESQADE